MLGKIKTKLKNRLDQVINARIKQEMDKQRAVVESLSKSFIQLSTEVTKQNHVVSDSLEDVLKRLQAVESKLENL